MRAHEIDSMRAPAQHFPDTTWYMQYGGAICCSRMPLSVCWLLLACIQIGVSAAGGGKSLCQPRCANYPSGNQLGDVAGRVAKVAPPKIGWANCALQLDPLSWAACRPIPRLISTLR